MSAWVYNSTIALKSSSITALIIFGFLSVECLSQVRITNSIKPSAFDVKRDDDAVV